MLSRVVAPTEPGDQMAARRRSKSATFNPRRAAQRAGQPVRGLTSKTSPMSNITAAIRIAPLCADGVRAGAALGWERQSASDQRMLRPFAGCGASLSRPARSTGRSANVAHASREATDEAHPRCSRTRSSGVADGHDLGGGLPGRSEEAGGGDAGLVEHQDVCGSRRRWGSPGVGGAHRLSGDVGGVVQFAGGAGDGGGSDHVPPVVAVADGQRHGRGGLFRIRRSR